MRSPTRSYKSGWLSSGWFSLWGLPPKLLCSLPTVWLCFHRCCFVELVWLEGCFFTLRGNAGPVHIRQANKTTLTQKSPILLHFVLCTQQWCYKVLDRAQYVGKSSAKQCIFQAFALRTPKQKRWYLLQRCFLVTNAKNRANHCDLCVFWPCLQNAGICGVSSQPNSLPFQHSQLRKTIRQHRRYLQCLRHTIALGFIFAIFPARDPTFEQETCRGIASTRSFQQMCQRYDWPRWWQEQK